MPPPLTRAAFHILLALAEQNLHGLGIADSVERTTDGDLDLGPGTLYRTLKLMVDLGLIREARAPSDDADPRRRYYAISAEGRRRAASEAARLSRMAQLARRKLLMPEQA